MRPLNHKRPCNTSYNCAGPRPTLSNGDHRITTPTTTIDMSAATRYAAPAYPAYHQEATDVTSPSDRPRRIGHSHVCYSPPRGERVHRRTSTIPHAIGSARCAGSSTSD